MMASIVAHAAVIGLAVQVTAGRASTPPAGPIEVVHLPMPEPPGPTHPVGRRPSSGGSPGARWALPPTPGIHIDVRTPGFPRPDASPGEMLEHVLRGLGTGGAVGAGGTAGGSGSYAPGVDVQARPLAGNPEPVYPSILRAQSIEGRVAARFIVDTTGRVDRASIRLVATGSDLFAAAVRRALEHARFTPARAAGRPVPMLMEREFVFRIAGR